MVVTAAVVAAMVGPMGGAKADTTASCVVEVAHRVNVDEYEVDIDLREVNHAAIERVAQVLGRPQVKSWSPSSCGVD